MKVLNRRGVSSTVGVYVGRPTKFGNPWRAGVHGSRAEVIARYEAHVRANPRLLQAVKDELKGKDLVCWCAPLACHADVLMQIANAETVAEHDMAQLDSAYEEDNQ